MGWLILALLLTLTLLLTLALLLLLLLLLCPIRSRNYQQKNENDRKLVQSLHRLASGHHDRVARFKDDVLFGVTAGNNIFIVECVFVRLITFRPKDVYLLCACELREPARTRERL